MRRPWRCIVCRSEGADDEPPGKQVTMLEPCDGDRPAHGQWANTERPADVYRWASDGRYATVCTMPRHRDDEMVAAARLHVATGALYSEPGEYVHEVLAS